MHLEQFDRGDKQHVLVALSLWNAACGPDLAVSQRGLEFNLRPCAGAMHDGRIIYAEGRAVGFALASSLRDDPETSSPGSGWIDAIAVHPDARGSGAGTALLAWAEGWAREQGCPKVMLGASLRPWVHGLPAALGSDGFFLRRGYLPGPHRARSWDMAHRLTEYEAPVTARRSLPITVLPGKQGQEEALVAYHRREFPGRWHDELKEYLSEGGRISDYMILWSERGIDGVCRLTFEDSERPLDRFYPHRLPHPWAQLGSIGVSADCRGKGYGAVLLDAGLRRLRDCGVDGCIIDWTGLLDFYGQFGFKPYREYLMLSKSLN